MKHFRPDFIIIGAMKCGTTSLYEYLAAHPETNACVDKEPEYFGTNWDKGLEWYKPLYKDVQGLRFEASTAYTKYPWQIHIPERIKMTAPDCKLIYIIRDPIERIVSHLYHLTVHHGIAHDAWRHKPGFWIDGGGKRAIDVSMYYTQVTRYLEYFAREDILVLHLEDLRSNPLQVFSSVASFIGISTEPLKEYTFKSFNQASNTIVASRPMLSKIVRGLKKTPGLASMAGLFGTEVGKPELTDSRIAYIWDILEEDMANLDKYLGYATGYTRPKEN